MIILRYILVVAVLFVLLLPRPGICQSLSGKVVSVALQPGSDQDNKLKFNLFSAKNRCFSGLKAPF